MLLTTMKKGKRKSSKYYDNLKLIAYMETTERTGTRIIKGLWLVKNHHNALHIWLNSNGKEKLIKFIRFRCQVPTTPTEKKPTLAGGRGELKQEPIGEMPNLYALY